MAKSDASSVKDYLQELPEERRKEVERVRKTILENLPKGYKEVLGFGMITYCLPLERYPDTYNKQPLCYAGLAAQKNHLALYLTNVYQDPALERELREGFESQGKKLDMGKSCIRSKKSDDLPLDTIGEIIASTPPDAFIERYETVRATATKAGQAKTSSPKNN